MSNVPVNAGFLCFSHHKLHDSGVLHSFRIFGHTWNMMKKLLTDFCKCGLLGWGLEIVFTALSSLRRREWKLMGQSSLWMFLFTALHSLRRRDLRLTGNTSLWMFPIYGCACILGPLSQLFKHLSIVWRGTIYAILIFAAEFFSGKFLKRHNICPWDYVKNRWQIGRVIRLDFFPCWFVVGLIYEKLLNTRS